VLLSWATGSVSSGKLSAFDVNGSKVHKVAGNSIVTIGNKDSSLWQHLNFKSKTLSIVVGLQQALVTLPY